MKSLVIFAAVLLVCQSASVPSEVIHKVTVPVPSNVLSPPPPPSVEQPMDTEVPALVTEVSKNHKHNPDQTILVPAEENGMTTQQPEGKTMAPVDIEITTIVDPLMAVEAQRETRAVPFSDSKKDKPQLSTDINVIKEILNQRKTNMANKPASARSTRSLEKEATTKVSNEKVTENPVIKNMAAASSSNIDPCDLLCTKFEFEPICATNGLCLHEFPNQCILESYNCKHKSVPFKATNDDRCQMHWLTKCDESDMI